MAPPAIDAMAKAYARWLNQASRLRDEALRFAQERLSKELEAAAELGRCTSPSDAFAVQADFANTMAADYLTEVVRRPRVSARRQRPNSTCSHADLP